MKKQIVSATGCEIPDHVPQPQEIKDILETCKIIAVVGISPKESRDSNRVARYLMEQGYDIVPVNPGQREILGKPCFRTLSDIPFDVDMVDLFLNPERVMQAVDQAIEMSVSAIWMQLGIIHNESACKARDAGIQVVMNKCIMKEHMKMFK